MRRSFWFCHGSIKSFFYNRKMLRVKKLFFLIKLPLRRLWCRNAQQSGEMKYSQHRLLSQERRRNIKLVVSVYQAIVCQQLLFGSETWILSNQQHKMLESFHRRCVRFLTGDYITKLPNGEWHYPKTEDVMQKAGLKSIKQYIEQRRQNVEKYMTMERETITELMESANIELNLERVFWWNNNTEPGPSQPT